MPYSLDDIDDVLFERISARLKQAFTERFSL